MKQKFSQAQSLGHQTGLAARLFNQLLTRRFNEAGIEMTAEQWGVILVLLNHGAMTQGKLAELLYLEKSTVSRSVSGLERRGWVVSSEVPGDRRQKQTGLTANATAVARRCAVIAQGVLKDAQAGLARKDVCASVALLSGVIGNLRLLNGQ